MRLRSNQTGFTLIELLIVITIIGVLSTFVSLNYGTVRAKARDDKRQSDLAAIALALEQYRVVNKHYPLAVSWANVATLSSELAPRYISAVPKEPVPTKLGVADYHYASDTVGGGQFVLDAALEQSSVDQALDPTIEISNNSSPNFFRTGYYKSSWDGPLHIHYRLSSQ